MFGRSVRNKMDGHQFRPHRYQAQEPVRTTEKRLRVVGIAFKKEEKPTSLNLKFKKIKREEKKGWQEKKNMIN